MLAVLARQDTSVPLTSLMAVIGERVPLLRGAPAAAGIAAGLRANALSPDRQVRFFARFVIGLIARNRYRPAGIMTAATPAQVSLDGVAMELILVRLAADLNSLRLRASTARNTGQDPGTTALLTAAGSAGPPGAGPCHTNELAGPHGSGRPRGPALNSISSGQTGTSVTNGCPPWVRTGGAPLMSRPNSGAAA